MRRVEMRDGGRTSWRSLRVAAALVLGSSTAVLTLPSANAAGAGGRGGAGPIFPRTTFYFGLGRPEARARRAFFAVPQPGSASYRRFVTPRQVAARYGASSAVRMDSSPLRVGVRPRERAGRPPVAQLAQLIPSPAGAVAGGCPTTDGAG